jgi:hypothetical protein
MVSTPHSKGAFFVGLGLLGTILVYLRMMGMIRVVMANNIATIRNNPM